MEVNWGPSQQCIRQRRPASLHQRLCSPPLPPQCYCTKGSVHQQKPHCLLWMKQWVKFWDQPPCFWWKHQKSDAKLIQRFKSHIVFCGDKTIWVTLGGIRVLGSNTNVLVKAPEFCCKDAAKVLFTTQPDAMLHQRLCLNQDAMSFVDKITIKVDQGAPGFYSQAPRFWSTH